MDVLNNISCCFDASKDIGEASVELVVCDCAISKRCCLRWETCTYAAAIVFSSADFIADVFAYISFVGIVSDPAPIKTYIDIWLVFIVISAIIIVSEIALPIYSVVKLRGCCENRLSADGADDATDKFRMTAKYWSRANNILVIATEDGVIALIRILIAFKSVEAVSDLQTTAGATTSCIAFAVTIMRHILLMVQLITKFSKNNVTFSKCPSWEKEYCTAGTCGLIALFVATLFLSCCSLGLTGMSMAISLELFDVHFNDSVDFLLNITLLSLFVPLAFVFSTFVIIITRW